jgi:hypothetical protein
MDMHDLRPDPCDNRLIRFSNCLVALSCFCDILAICFAQFRDCAQCLDSLAQMVFYCTLGCMAAQVDREISYHKRDRMDVATAVAVGHTSDLRSPIIQNEHGPQFEKPIKR